jgi:hypothetical protein
MSVSAAAAAALPRNCSKPSLPWTILAAPLPPNAARLRGQPPSRCAQHVTGTRVIPGPGLALRTEGIVMRRLLLLALAVFGIVPAISPPARQRRPDTRAAAPTPDNPADPVLDTIAKAAYQSGARAETVNAAWLGKRLCLRDNGACFEPMPAALVESVCGRKPCWPVTGSWLTGRGRGVTHAKGMDPRLTAVSADATHIPDELSLLSMTMGVDLVPFCCRGTGFTDCFPAPQQCTGSTMRIGDLGKWAAGCGCVLNSRTRSRSASSTAPPRASIRLAAFPTQRSRER